MPTEVLGQPDERPERVAEDGRSGGVVDDLTVDLDLPGDLREVVDVRQAGEGADQEPAALVLSTTTSGRRNR